MRTGRTVQPVSYALRLPDAVQAAALRLLDVSREAINSAVAADDGSGWTHLVSRRALRLQTGHRHDELCCFARGPPMALGG